MSKMLRWIGVAILPFPVALLLGLLINIIVTISMNILFRNGSLSYHTAQVISSVPCGAVIPFLTGAIAPNCKKTAAIVVSSVSSFLILISTLFCFLARNYFGAVTTGISLVACIATTVIICRLVEAQRSDSIDRIADSNYSIGEKFAIAREGVGTVLFLIFRLALKLILWFVGLLILAFVNHWAWNCIGDGVGWTIVGVIVLAMVSPSVIGAVFKMLYLSWALIPILTFACFNQD